MSERDSASVRVGATLRGKWTLERVLGEGGMASVYAARHKIGRMDAIKVMHPMYAAMPQLRARFEQEARAVNSFKHAGAVEIRDIDASEDGVPFLVMELLEGETLTSMARRGPIEVSRMVQIADEVLDVLAAAHGQGILHRDIKPDNLFVLKDGHVKVLDFGIARVKDSLPGDLKTKTGTTLGTVSYMPPEQARGMEIDERADVYAVGATMFRVLARRHVHEAATEVERLMKVVSEPAAPLATVAAEVPAGVCSVIDRALAFDRDARYPTATAMQADVRSVAREPTRVPDGAAKREASTRAEAVPIAAARVPAPVPASELAAASALAPEPAPAPALAPAPAPAPAPALALASAVAPASGVATALVGYPAISVAPTRAVRDPAAVVPTVVAPSPAIASAAPPPVASAPMVPSTVSRPGRILWVVAACGVGGVLFLVCLVWALWPRASVSRSPTPLESFDPAGVTTITPATAPPSANVPPAPPGTKPSPTTPAPPGPNPVAPPSPPSPHDPAPGPNNGPGHGKHHGR